MLDRSVPYYPVIMTLPVGDRPQPEVLLDQAEKLLPEGYRLVRWSFCRNRPCCGSGCGLPSLRKGRR